MKWLYRRFGLAAVFLLAVLPVGLSVGFDRNEPVAPLPEIEAPDPKKVGLGRALFFDPILSGSESVSCATCHDLDQGGTIRVGRATGLADGRGLFNVPTIFNVANNHSLGWRGHVKTLAAQNEKVLLDANLMAITWDTLLARLAASPGYKARFEDIYGFPPTRDALLDALASFEMSLRTPDAPFDRYMRGDLSALSADQAFGYRLFKDYGCISCHQGSNIGGNMTQRLGIFSAGDAVFENGNPVSSGANGDDAADEDQAFRVPSLRNVALTAPYFHDGRAERLPQAVSLMGKLQLGRDLPDADVAAITAFLESLTGRYDEADLSSPPDAPVASPGTSPVISTEGRAP